MKFGLNEATINKITPVFAQYPSIEKVIIYGSRAKGNYKMGSDIDLTLIGDKISHQIFLELLRKLDDLNLPYTFDLSIFEHINNLDVKEHIQRVGVEFYSPSYRTKNH